MFDLPEKCATSLPEEQFFLRNDFVATSLLLWNVLFGKAPLSQEQIGNIVDSCLDLHLSGEQWYGGQEIG